jgi:8-oxo-dGTP pyrophosphatase MutT (NUDIX family)
VRRTSLEGVQICLIRKKNSVRWGIPKGYIEHASAKGAALNEASEEAGLSGQIIGDRIGTYDRKGVVSLTVVVFLMNVVNEQVEWPERRWRERRWYSLDEADALLRNHPIWPLFNRICSSLKMPS